ncbi:MAG: glycosyltransferase family 4 protein [Gammaproteobacteria bacterium]|nr:glycosyltransferase family 4 protein [Gammaproteobacteria bacterium]
MPALQASASDYHGRLLYVCPEDRFFCTHFLERAVAARKAGYEVLVLAPDTGSGPVITGKGLTFVPLALKRHGANPLAELVGTVYLAHLYRRLAPNIVHHIGLKLIFRGTLAARLAHVPHIVNAPVGMGFVFSSQSLKARLLRPVVRTGLKQLLAPGPARVVFENPEDQAECVRMQAAPLDRTMVIRGAGVDTGAFRPSPEPAGTPVVVMAARLLWAKGVGVFVEAARLLQAQGVNVRCVLVGGVDLGNAASVPEARLRAWHEEGVIEWWGFQEDIRPALREATLFCLPTHYREGLPKVILEAMAMGRPVITTDAIGCREAVKDGDNGRLIPPRSPAVLASAITELLADPLTRKRMGRRGRERAEREFAVSVVVGETLSLYARLMAHQPESIAPRYV